MSPSTPVKGLCLRRVSLADARCLWAWSHDAEVQRFSFDEPGLSLDAYTQWLQERLADPKCTFVILQDGDNKALGQLRIEPGPLGMEIDLSIDQAFRGSGLGKHLLLEGMRAFSAHFPEQARLAAKIVLDNQASLALFESCGFRVVSAGVMQDKRYVAVEYALRS